MMDMDKAIQRCTLFRDLPDREMECALSFFRAAGREYQKGQALNRPGEVFSRFGLVLSGAIHINSYESDPPVVMATVSPGSTFGESLCFLGLPAPVHAFAASKCRVLWLSTDGVKRPPATELEQKLQQRFTAMIAEKALSMNDRIQILTRHTMRDKVLTLLYQYGREGEEFLLPFDREHMAAYLGADRSALSRELSRMKADGLIDYRKNRFRLT